MLSHLVLDTVFNQQVQTLLANQDSLVAEAKAQALTEAEVEAAKAIQAQKDIAAKIRQDAEDALQHEKANALEFRSRLEEAAAAETATLRDQLSELARQNNALHGLSAVTAAPVTSTATTVTTAPVSNLTAMLDNLRKYNELTQGLSRATLPSAPHATIPVYSPDFEALPAKHLRVDGNEFHLDGRKKVTELFTGVDFTGLIMQNSMPPDIRNSIAKDKFFEISKLYKCDEVVSTVLSAPSSGAPGVTVTATTTSGASGKDPTTKSEIFYLLYQFGMFYLQLYPAKIAGFLEYLGFLTKEAKDFNVAGLLRLDNAIRSQYINHPDWNWDQSRTEISRAFNQLSRHAENLLPGAVVHVVKGSAATPSKQPRGGVSMPSQDRVPSVFSPSHSGPLSPSTVSSSRLC